MKNLSLILFILFSLNFGFSQNELSLSQDSIVKFKKQERIKANTFIINTIGKNKFYKYFNLVRVDFYKTPTPLELEENVNSQFYSEFLCVYDFDHKSITKKEDLRFLKATDLNYNYLIITYNLSIRGFDMDQFSQIHLVHDVRNDSLYFSQPERIPSFILNNDSSIFIPNDILLNLIQGYYPKLSNWKKINEKTRIRNRYSSKCKKYVFDVSIILKRTKKGQIKKVRQLIIDSLNGNVLDDYISDDYIHFEEEILNVR